MKNRILILNLIISIVLLMSCGSEEKSKNEKLVNTFRMNNKIAKECGLPEVGFSIKYPKDIKVNKAKPKVLNDNYVSFVIEENDVTEELTIGYLEHGNSDLLKPNGLAEMLLNQFRGSFLSVDSAAETVFKGKKKFCGKESYQLQMRYEITSNEFGEIGEWMINIILYPGSGKNGVMLIFQTNGNNTQINDFSDFGKKGLTGEMWETFKMDDN